MKKIYISPETTLFKVHTENVMNNTSIGVKTYKDLSAKKDEVTIKTNYNFSDKGISIWTGTQPETAKDNNGFDLWGDED